MQCPHCKAEWKEGNTKSQQQLENCPFCGESLVVKKEEAPDTNTLGGVLRSLVLEQGTDIYKAENGHKLKAFLSDMAVAFPKERKTLNIAIQENIPSKLLSYDSKEDEEKEIILYDCIHQLEDEYGMKKERAIEVVNYLVVGLGWQVKYKQAETQQASQQQPTKHVAGFLDTQSDISTVVETAQENISDNMVYVEGGTFWMGSNGGYANESPVHEVMVGSFYMCKYAVTQAEYKSVIGSNPSYFKGKNLPVENVSWYDAVEYCNALSRKEGLTPCYSGRGKNITCNWKANGYRLPTEAEWEYAAKGGINKNVYRYSGSNNINEVTWYDGNSGEKTHEVGLKKANRLGIFDMSGNVREWCWDLYASDYYKYFVRNNPTGDLLGSCRVYRGGSWGSYASSASVSYRDSYDPNGCSSNLGFRVVRASTI